MSLVHKFSSSEFWPLCTEYSTSRVETQSYFKDQPVYKGEVQEMRRFYYFFEIFYCNLHYYNPWCKLLNISVQWFQEMTVNIVTWLNYKNSFSKVSRLFSHITRSMFLVFRATLRRLALNSTEMCYIMKTKNIKL